jgi:hypothetical protein
MQSIDRLNAIATRLRRARIASGRSDSDDTVSICFALSAACYAIACFLALAAIVLA